MTEPSRVAPRDGAVRSRLSVVNLGLASFADEPRRRRRRGRRRWTGGRRRAATPRCSPRSTRIAQRRAPTSRRPTRRRSSACSPPSRRSSASASPARSSPACARTSCCTPARRSTWERMCGPMRGAVIGGLHLRGAGDDRAEEAERSPPRARSRSRPATTTAPSARWPASSPRRMPVWILENAAFGNRAYCHAQRGARQGAALRRLLRRGARRGCAGWRQTLAPVLRRRSPLHGPLDLQQRHRPGAADGRRGAQPQPRRHLAADPRAGAAPGAGSASRRERHRARSCASSTATTTSSSTSRCRRASARSTRRAGIEGSIDDHRHGAQRHRLRHPGLGPRRPLVHGARARWWRASTCRASPPRTPRPTSATR